VHYDDPAAGWEVRCYQWLKKAYRIAASANASSTTTATATAAAATVSKGHNNAAVVDGGLSPEAAAEMLQQHDYIRAHLYINLPRFAQDLWLMDVAHEKALQQLSKRRAKPVLVRCKPALKLHHRRAAP
jgi:hypothetical protein